MLQSTCALQHWLLVWWEKSISTEYPARTYSEINILFVIRRNDVIENVKREERKRREWGLHRRLASLFPWRLATRTKESHSWQALPTLFSFFPVSFEKYWTLMHTHQSCSNLKFLLYFIIVEGPCTNINTHDACKWHIKAKMMELPSSGNF